MKDNFWKIDPISLFSHELKTPLSSLKIGLNLLKKDFKKNENLLDLLQEEVDRMIDFITDNLDLRFIQKNQDQFQFSWEKFDSCLKKTCSSLQILAKQNQVVFKLENVSQNKEFEVFMDKNWFLNLLENLLTNSIKHSPKNQSIFIKYGLNKTEQFFCSVSNSGEGFKNKDKVFDLFYKESSSTKGNKNTGLGLSIVKAIVEAHGGFIEILSDPQGKSNSIQFVISKVRLLQKSA